MTINDKLFKQWGKMGRQWLGKSPLAAGETIQQVLGRAFKDAGLFGKITVPPMPDMTMPGMPPSAKAPQDAPMRDINPAPPRARKSAKAAPASAPDGELPGRFTAGKFANAAGVRDYKLYVPGSYRADGKASLVVMLHGCTQNADDFAAGTRMNAIAEQHNCVILYPQQASGDNAAKCWNWFSPDDQRHGRGEPAIIAGMTGQIAAEYKIDAGRIFIGGLSAGGAMAAIMASQYPQLYRAYAVHSGLPHGAAHDLPSALAAMKGGAANGTGGKAQRPAGDGPAVPVIVFHGDRDATVSPRNGAELIRTALEQAGHAQTGAQVEQGEKEDGHRYTRHIYRDDKGQSIAEHWVIHGAAHAWSGGHTDGTYTDIKGPDASAEMLRFFHQQPAR